MSPALLAVSLVVSGLGVATCLVATSLRGAWRGPVFVTGLAVGVAPAFGGGLVLLFGVTVRAWDAHPEAVRTAAISLMVLLTIASIGAHAVRRPRHAPDDEGPDDGDDGGGGGGRREPVPPAPGAPCSPRPVPPAPWAEFDDLRRQWERVPAGRR